VDGFKGDVAIRPKAKDHAERRSKGKQGNNQEKTCDKKPEHRHGSNLCAVSGSLSPTYNCPERSMPRIITGRDSFIKAIRRK
jgi:hypothetical protein